MIWDVKGQGMDVFGIQTHFVFSLTFCYATKSSIKCDNKCKKSSRPTS